MSSKTFQYMDKGHLYLTLLVKKCFSYLTNDKNLPIVEVKS